MSPHEAPVGLVDNPILVEVVRGGLVECVHRGRAVVTNPDGSVRWSAGDVEAPMYPRSSLKPLQVLAMLGLGLDLEGRLLALAAASHSGEQYHLDGVLEILDGAGLGLDALQNTPDLPIDEAARAAWLRSGRDAEPLTQNCSGKHAAMLRTCVRAGLDTATYRDPGHRLQRAIAETIAARTGSASAPTLDGCGAPLFACSSTGLARAFGALAAATQGPEAAIANAYRAFPEYASGTGRADLDLHRAVPGLFGKGGAEGCFALGLPDGTGVVIKFDDGAGRGVKPLASQILTGLGIADLEEHHTDPVLGHGEPVGQVRVAPELLASLASL